MSKENGEKLMYCSFCGRSNDEVNKMIAADSGSLICNECVLQCVEILIPCNQTNNNTTRDKD